jgi:hypothetical protein
MAGKHNSTNTTFLWRVLKADSYWLWILNVLAYVRISHTISHTNDFKITKITDIQGPSRADFHIYIYTINVLCGARFSHVSPKKHSTYNA